MPRKDGEQCEEIVLNADYLVIQAKNVFADEAGRRMVMAAAFVCHHRLAPRTLGWFE